MYLNLDCLKIQVTPTKATFESSIFIISRFSSEVSVLKYESYFIYHSCSNSVYLNCKLLTRPFSISPLHAFK